jgi:hypothetical protein
MNVQVVEDDEDQSDINPVDFCLANISDGRLVCSLCQDDFLTHNL